MGQLLRTPLYEKHVSQGAKIVDFAGFEMPIQYTSILQEHEAVRSNVGMFDVSHMGEILVRGPQATAYLEHVCTNTVSTLQLGQVRYSFLCYENGTVVDDVLIYRFEEELYCLVVNASNIEKDYAWLKRHLIPDVELENVSEKTSEIALQGPLAEATLQTMTSVDVSQIGFFQFVWGDVLGAHTLISRTGYTGEDGFELYTDNESILHLWDEFLAKGVTPIGLGARDTLRFEASLPLYGHEISDTITPLEAGFKRFVDLSKSFIGKPALEQPRTRKLVGIEVLDRGIARATYPVLDRNHNDIGFITTGYMLGGRTLALALVNATISLGDSVVVVMRDKHLKGTVISTKFKDKNYKK